MSDHEKTPEEEKELILRIIRYVKRHHRVTLSQIIAELKLDDVDSRYMQKTLVQPLDLAGSNSPNHILAAVNRPINISRSVGEQRREDEYQLLPTAIFSYIDYLEISAIRAPVVPL